MITCLWLKDELSTGDEVRLGAYGRICYQKQGGMSYVANGATFPGHTYQCGHFCKRSFGRVAHVLGLFN